MLGVKAGFRVKCGHNWVKYNRAAWIMGELERSRAKKKMGKVAERVLAGQEMVVSRAVRRGGACGGLRAG